MLIESHTEEFAAVQPLSIVTDVLVYLNNAPS